MVQFNEEKQNKHLEQIHEQEEENLMRMLAPRHNAMYIDLTSIPINTDALALITEKHSRGAEAVIFNKNGKALDVAFHSPSKNELRTLIASLEKRGYTTSLYMASKKSLETAWERYKDVSFASESTKGLLDVSSEEIVNFLSEVRSFEEVRKHIQDTLHMKKAYRISRIVEVLIAGALALKSSDIHVEPEETKVRIRYRVDGILADVAFLESSMYKLILSRIKLLSGLKLNVQKEAQDGRYSIHVEDKNIEIRTSIIPGEYGESIVMRILNPDAISVTIEELGMDADLLKRIEHEISKPNGLILTTGPTGSGKTTTLYAFLKKVHTPAVKILTIEDPIEYHMEGIVQTQTEEESEYTFSSGLRAVMRQDPDIIMVGEIRDSETAEIAMHAALTGHTVFSTLHTNSAPGAFPRLADLGINSSVMGSGINVAMAQRLVRKLCPECKEKVPLEGEDKETIDTLLESVFDQEKIASLQREFIWKAGNGCTACGGDGYKGRVGIYEAVFVDKEIESLLRMNPSEREIRDAARTQGVMSLAQDSAVKILNGVTTIEEAERVVDLAVEEQKKEELEPETTFDSKFDSKYDFDSSSDSSLDTELPPLTDDPLPPLEDTLPHESTSFDTTFTEDDKTSQGEQNL